MVGVSPLITQIAAAQAVNPNNPYLNYSPVPPPQASSSPVDAPAPPAPPAAAPPAPSNPYAPRPDDNPAAFQPRSDDSTSLYGSIPKGSPPTVYSSNNPASPNYVPPPTHSQSVGVPAKPLATTGVGGGSASSGPAPKSLEQKEFDEEEGARDILSENEKKKEQSLREQQGLLDVAAFQNQQDLKSANWQYEAGQNELESMQRNTYYNAREKARGLDQEAAALRNQKIDPRHWFNDLGTAGKILAAISMGAGAFAAAMPHTNSNTNQALGIINNAVTNDIDSQKANLEKGWDMLKFKGEQAEKDYVRDQWMQNQKKDMLYKNYDQAMNMMSQQRQTTKDAVAAKNLDMMMAETANEKAKIIEDRAQARYKVGVAERSAANAANAANPFTALNTTKAYMKYREAWEAANIKAQASGDSPIPLKSMAEWLPSYQGKGAEAGAGGGGATAGAEELERIGGDAAKNAGLMTSIMGKITPGGTLSQDTVNQYNTLGKILLKGRENRLTPEQLQEQWESTYAMGAGLSDAQKAARLQAMQRMLSVTGKLAKKPAPNNEESQ